MHPNQYALTIFEQYIEKCEAQLHGKTVPHDDITLITLEDLKSKYEYKGLTTDWNTALLRAVSGIKNYRIATMPESICNLDYF